MGGGGIDPRGIELDGDGGLPIAGKHARSDTFCAVVHTLKGVEWH